MAISHATQRRLCPQPPSNIKHAERQQAAEQMDGVLKLINLVERLPVLSAEIIRDTKEGEAYEVLVRRIRSLHTNIVELADLAAASKSFHF